MITTRQILKVAIPACFVLVMLLVAVAGAVTLDGAKVFRDNCVKCHSERSPMEKTDAEWDVTVTHMRTVAGMTADEARAVLKFLKDNN